MMTHSVTTRMMIGVAGYAMAIGLLPGVARAESDIASASEGAQADVSVHSKDDDADKKKAASAPVKIEGSDIIVVG